MSPPVFGVVGWKNSGKTTLMSRLIRELTRRGYAVSVIKHAHVNFDIDHPGRDSFEIREAGARQVMLSSSRRFALMRELGDEPEMTLEDLLERAGSCDVILVEGYKRDTHPKVEAHRQEPGNPLIAPEDPTIRAVASDVELHLDRPVFDLNDTKAIADFILSEVGL